MSRQLGAKCRLCRREGMKLYLKSKRCESAKCPFEGQKTRAYPPGQAGKLKMRGKFSTFGKGLREKQKLKRIYGIFEKQFKIYFREATKNKGNTADHLALIVEKRLDNVLYQMGVTRSRTHARQLIVHGHVKINNRRVNVPAYAVKPAEIITFRDKEKIRTQLTEIAAENAYRAVPGWLSFDVETLQGEILAMPTVDDVKQPLQMQLIVEIASR